jgi:hypothetical protein
MSVVHIGLNDIQTEGSFVWTNRDSSAYRNWILGEPNNAGDEDCVDMQLSGQWNDIACAAVDRFLCSRRVVVSVHM